MDKNRTRYVAVFAIMVSLALIFSYVETLIPPIISVPGMKLGITNIVVVVMLYLYGEKSAIAINFVRVLLVAILFGNGVSLVYSLAGAILSIIVMIALKRFGRFHLMSVSICGAVAHNAAQMIVAMLIFKTTSLLWYFVILWLFALVSGGVIGALSALIVVRIKKASL